MSIFCCSVCFEQRSSRLALGKVTTGNGEILRAADCEHPICRECLASHVRVRVEEQRVFGLRCPAIGCSCELYEKDLRSLVDFGNLPAEVCERFVELRARDFTARVRSFETMAVRGDEDVEFLETLRTMRRCPRCQLLLQRSQGCDSFYCICGTNFNYSQAEPGIGGKSKSWSRTIVLAREEHLSVAQVAEFASRPHRLHRAEVTAAQLGISRAEALDLHSRAKQGDEEARLRIRQSRAQPRSDRDAREPPEREDEPSTEEGCADSAGTEAEHAVSNMAAATGHVMPAPLVSTMSCSQRSIEAMAALDLLATQVLVTILQALQPSVATAGRAPGMPSRCKVRRKLEAGMAAPSRRAMGRQNLLAGKTAEQPRRGLGRRGH